MKHQKLLALVRNTGAHMGIDDWYAKWSPPKVGEYDIHSDNTRLYLNVNPVGGKTYYTIFLEGPETESPPRDLPLTVTDPIRAIALYLETVFSMGPDAPDLATWITITQEELAQLKAARES